MVSLKSHQGIYNLLQVSMYDLSIQNRLSGMSSFGLFLNLSLCSEWILLANTLEMVTMLGAIY